MRTPLALAGLALVLSASVTCTSAEAATPMCQGQAPTIVELEDGQVVGTDADDVIVLQTDKEDFSPFIDAAAGDDLICLFGTLQGDESGEGGAVVVGGEGDDSLLVKGFNNDDVLILDSSTERIDVSLRFGDDEVRLMGAAGTGEINAGLDGGRIKVIGDEVRLDLGERRLKVDSSFDYTLTGFTRAFASGRRVVMHGDGRANVLTAEGCRTTVRGRDGNDILKASVNTSFEDCTPRGAHLFGDRGDDRMVGTVRGDVISGGAGRDKANGGQGIDTCAAEKETSCER